MKTLFIAQAAGNAQEFWLKYTLFAASRSPSFQTGHGIQEFECSSVMKKEIFLNSSI